jgi:hypothetical protein
LQPSFRRAVQCQKTRSPGQARPRCAEEDSNLHPVPGPGPQPSPPGRSAASEAAHSVRLSVTAGTIRMPWNGWMLPRALSPLSPVRRTSHGNWLGRPTSLAERRPSPRNRSPCRQVSQQWSKSPFDELQQSTAHVKRERRPSPASPYATRPRSSATCATPAVARHGGPGSASIETSFSEREDSDLTSQSARIA